MANEVASNHPKQKLLFFVAQDLDDNVRATMRNFVLNLASIRRWLNGAPRFVNARDEPEDASGGDVPIETVGGYVEIYTALPPWRLSREVDAQHLDEVTTLVNALCKLSNEDSLAIELELDGTFVGSIENGKMDTSLADGFLGEWRRHLGS